MQRQTVSVDNLPKLILHCSDYPAGIFDLDGVITQTARVHSAVWKEMFDGFLKQYGKNSHTTLKPFDLDQDYLQYVDGKPRYNGVSSFLASRHIDLPMGKEKDPAGWETVCALGNMKNKLYLQRLHQDGVDVYPSSVALIRSLKKMGLKTAVVSSSKNCEEVLQIAKLTDLFEVRVDGNVAEQHHLQGKPAPDTYLYAAQQLGIPPEHAVVFEDALSGVESGKRGHFGMVIGVNRQNQAEALKAHGANFVVDDLNEIAWKKP
jgi:beta-phosphoglucomutase family hydrolase